MVRNALVPVLILLCCSVVEGQPPAGEVIAKFRKVIGTDGPVVSTPYVIKHRGKRFLYSLAGGRLEGQSYDFEVTLIGFTDNLRKQRKEMEMKIGIVPFKMIEVVDGDSGWIQINDGDPVVMSKKQIQGRRQREHHIEAFLGQEGFGTEAWKFTEPKGTRAHGLEAWEFDAETAGLEPITLTFAKESGLLLRLKTKTTDFDLLPGAEPKVESFTRDLHFYDWKKLGNRLSPGHLDVFQDGVLWTKMQPVSVELPKTHDAQLFVMPKTKE